MTTYSSGQLAELRRQQLIDDAACYRRLKAYRPTIHPRRGVRRPITAIQNWRAAGPQ